MRPARVKVALLAAAAALAIPAAALAAPTIPRVHAVSERVTVFPGASTFTVVWDPSAFDPDAMLGYYEVALTRYPTGSPSAASTATEKVGCCTYAFPITPGYHYVVRVRGAQFYNCGIYGFCNFSWSPWWVVWFDAVSPPVYDF